MTSTFNDYVLERTSAEYQRLRRQSQIWEEATERALRKAGLAPGMTCLDAGCGPGEVMRLMREKVGPSGHVTGADIDAAIGAEALAALTTHFGSNIAFHKADLMADTISGAPFDLVFARFVLFHQKQPIDFLQRMWALTKPGGTLLIMDHDFLTGGGWPAYVQPIGSFIHDTFGRSGIDPAIARKIPELMLAAGIGAPDGADISTIFVPGSQAAPMVIAVAQSLFPAAEKMGSTTAADFNDMLEAYKKSAATETAWMYWPLLNGLWKRKAGLMPPAPLRKCLPAFLATSTRCLGFATLRCSCHDGVAAEAD